MDFSPKFRADSFIYPAEHKDIMKIQEEVQKKLKHYDIEKETAHLKDYEQGNAILTLYGRVAYEEGYRKGLQSLKSQNQAVVIKRRSSKAFVYMAEDETELIKLTQKRMKSKRMRNYRTEYCQEHNLEDNEESFVLSLVIHTFFESAYSKVTLDTSNIFKNMHPEDEEKAKKMSGIFDELFSGVLGDI